MVHAGISRRPDIMDLIRRWRADNDPVSYPDACMVMAAGVTELIRPEKPIIVPTLVMTCENDTGSTPDMSHAIASEIPGAETIIVPGLQHYGPDRKTGSVHRTDPRFPGPRHGTLTSRPVIFMIWLGLQAVCVHVIFWLSLQAVCVHVMFFVKSEGWIDMDHKQFQEWLSGIDHLRA